MSYLEMTITGAKMRRLLIALVTLAAACRGGDVAGPDLQPPPVLPVKSVVIYRSESLYVGSSIKLSAVVTDVSNKIVYDRTITWTTSDPAVATVSESGLVQGVIEGPVTVTAKVGDVEDTMKIDVLPPIDWWW